MKKIVPFVSIGMPVFNGEKYIHEAIDSLINQIHQNFELIISDNASTDKTEIICQKYALKDSRIRYIKQPRNIGALANFKYVLDGANGKYFMWAAADDVWSANWISSLLSVINNSNSGAAFGRLQSIDKEGREIRHSANNSVFKYSGPTWIRLLKYFIEFEGAGKANPIYSLWKIEIIKEINIEKYIYDYLLVFDLLKKTEILNSNKSIIYKRIHQDSEGSGVQVNLKKTFVKSIARKLIQLFQPIPILLILGYIRHSSIIFKIFIIIAIPLKYFSYYSFLLSNKIFIKNISSGV